MILSKFVFTKISSKNVKYWRSLEYDVQGGGRAGICNGQRIRVKVVELQSGSNCNVACRCDECSKKYIQRFCRDTNVCYACRRIIQMLNNTYGSANKGKKGMIGETHPKWNPHKKEILAFTRSCHYRSRKTYNEYKHIINPHNHPRTLCGVPGGYQLDHKVSIKEGYILGWTPEQVAVLENLQMLSWENNRSKW